MDSNKNTNKKLTIELYGLLPSAAALLCLAIIRNDHLAGSPAALLLLVLAVGAFAVSQGLPLLFVLAFVLLDKGLFHHPYVPLIGATALSAFLFLRAEERYHRAVFNGSLVLLGIGLLPALLPRLTGPLVLLLLAAAGLAFALLLLIRHRVHLLTNPLVSLSPTRPDNRQRFGLFCVAFLSIGSLSWGYLTQVLPSPGLAAIAHIGFSLTLVPTLLAILGLEAIDPAEIDKLTTQAEQLAAELAAKQKELSDLHATTDVVRSQHNSHLDNASRELERVSLQVDALRQAAAEKLENDLSLQRKEANAALEAAYYQQPWDTLTAHLCGKEVVSIPGGQTLTTTDHLLIGVRDAVEGATRREPIFLPKEILHEHVHILGGTGSGKTSLGITPVAIQLLRQNPPSPVIFLDLKGDRAAFHTAREEAERNNQDFLFFTIESNKATFRFNPFIGIKKHGGSRNEQAQPILDALNLDHGEGYGRSFFSRLHRQRLLEILRKHPNIHTFSQLQAALKEVPSVPPGRQSGYSTTQKDELIAAIEGISEYPQLFTTPEEEASGSGIIQFDKVYEKRQVVYFWIPAPTQSISAREIGKLVLYNLFFAALKRKDAGQFTQAYLLIDEFQKLIGANLALFLEQCRSFGISLVLANQNIDQLNSHDSKLWPLVQSNVRASLHFGSGDPKEIELLSKASGEMISTLAATSEGSSTGSSRGRSRTKTNGKTVTNTESTSDSSGTTYSESESFGRPTTYGHSSQSGRTESSSYGESLSSSLSEGESDSASESESREITHTEYIRPVFRPEDVASIFNKPRHFIYWVRRGAQPYTDFDGKPIAVEGIYTMPRHLYERRDKAPWPVLPSLQGHTIRTSEDYKASKVVTEQTMVKQLLDSLKEPY